MPFSGRGPVLVAFPGAALGALPPSTMAEAFGLKGCRLAKGGIEGRCLALMIISHHSVNY